MRIDERLLSLREKRGLTREQVAEALDVSRQTVYNWETGKIVPKTDYMIDIAEFYGLTLDELVYGDKGPKEEPVPVAEEPALPAFVVTDTKQRRLSPLAVRVAIILCVLASVIAICVGIYSFYSREEGRDIVPIEELESEKVDISSIIDVSLK